MNIARAVVIFMAAWLYAPDASVDEYKAGMWPIIPIEHFNTGPEG